MGLNSKSNTGEGAQAVASPTNKSIAGPPSILNVSRFFYRIDLASSHYGDKADLVCWRTFRCLCSVLFFCCDSQFAFVSIVDDFSVCILHVILRAAFDTIICLLAAVVHCDVAACFLCFLFLFLFFFVLQIWWQWYRCILLALFGIAGGARILV